LLAILAAHGDARLASDAVMRVLGAGSELRRRWRAVALADALHVCVPSLARSLVEYCVVVAARTSHPHSSSVDAVCLRWLLSIVATASNSTSDAFRLAVLNALSSDVVCGALMTELCSSIETVRSHAYALLNCAFTSKASNITTTTIESTPTVLSSTSMTSSEAVDEFGDSLGDSNRNRIRVLNGAIHRLHRCAMLNQTTTEYLKRFSKCQSCFFSPIAYRCLLLLLLLLLVSHRHRIERKVSQR
jgi:hypothetical protein